MMLFRLVFLWVYLVLIAANLVMPGYALGTQKPIVSLMLWAIGFICLFAALWFES